jgi:hypothetical protein
MFLHLWGCPRFQSWQHLLCSLAAISDQCCFCGWWCSAIHVFTNVFRTPSNSLVFSKFRARVLRVVVFSMCGLFVYGFLFLLDCVGFGWICWECIGEGLGPSQTSWKTTQIGWKSKRLGPTMWSTCGRQVVDSRIGWSTGGRHVVDGWSTGGRHVVDRWSTGGRQVVDVGFSRKPLETVGNRAIFFTGSMQPTRHSNAMLDANSTHAKAKRATIHEEQECITWV